MAIQEAGPSTMVSSSVEIESMSGGAKLEIKNIAVGWTLSLKIGNQPLKWSSRTLHCATLWPEFSIPQLWTTLSVQLLAVALSNQVQFVPTGSQWYICSWLDMLAAALRAFFRFGWSFRVAHSRPVTVLVLPDRQPIQQTIHHVHY